MKENRQNVYDCIKTKCELTIKIFQPHVGKHVVSLILKFLFFEF